MSKKICVIGGGPAGMIAAGRAAVNGADVVLIEKNKHLGVKLLITGKGRCNITNIESERRFLTEKYGAKGKFLFSALSRFGVEEIIAFFEKLDVPTKVERGGRVFPKSDNSADVLTALGNYMNKNKVRVVKATNVKEFVKKGSKIEKLLLDNGQSVMADEFIICTGGKSYPETGSTGGMYQLIEKLGHTINSPKPSLVPILCREKFIKDLEGLSLKNVEISVWQQNKKKDSRFGEALFTASGMSGPIILDMSKQVGELLSHGEVCLQIDFKPSLSDQILDKRIQKDFQAVSNKMFKNSLDKLLPKKLIPVLIKLSGIDPDKKVNSITKEERKFLLKLLKQFELKVVKLEGFEKAIITAGGVELKEVDPKTMQSKIISNLYFAGEVLDLDGPTGGYNLQVAWSTGFAAGDSVTSE
jgi:predicted Rossmann fold flavoprotein